MAGFGGRIGTGLQAVGGIGAGVVPGAEMLAFAGGLLAKLDPEDKELMPNPLPADPYAPEQPLWGVPRHPDDVSEDPNGLTLELGGDTPLEGDQVSQGEIERLVRDELAARGSERQYLSGRPNTGVEQAKLLKIPGDGRVVPGFTDFGVEVPLPRSYTFTEAAAKKSVWARQVLTVDTAHVLLARMIDQEASAPTVPVFHYIDRRGLGPWTWAYFHDNAIVDGGGSVRVRRADSDGPSDSFSNPVSGLKEWRSRLQSGSGVRAYRDALLAESDAQVVHETKLWNEWRLEVARQRELAELQAEVAAKIGAHFNAIIQGKISPFELGLTPADLEVAGLSSMPSTQSVPTVPAPRPSGQALIAAAVVLVALGAAL